MKPRGRRVVFNTAMMGLSRVTYRSFIRRTAHDADISVGRKLWRAAFLEDNGLPTFMESDKIYASAIIVADYSESYCHWNAVESPCRIGLSVKKVP